MGENVASLSKLLVTRYGIKACRRLILNTVRHLTLELPGPEKQLLSYLKQSKQFVVFTCWFSGELLLPIRLLD